MGLTGINFVHMWDDLSTQESQSCLSPLQEILCSLWQKQQCKAGGHHKTWCWTRAFCELWHMSPMQARPKMFASRKINFTPASLCSSNCASKHFPETDSWQGGECLEVAFLAKFNKALRLSEIAKGTPLKWMNLAMLQLSFSPWLGANISPVPGWNHFWTWKSTPDWPTKQVCVLELGCSSEEISETDVGLCDDFLASAGVLMSVDVVVHPFFHATKLWEPSLMPLDVVLFMSGSKFCFLPWRPPFCCEVSRATGKRVHSSPQMLASGQERTFIFCPWKVFKSNTCARAWEVLGCPNHICLHHLHF